MKKTKPGDNTSSIETEVPVSDIIAQFSKHRSCWVHMVTSIYTRGEKILKHQVNDLWVLELTSKCVFGTFPSRRRSYRRTKCPRTITKPIIKKETQMMYHGEKKKLNFGESKRLSSCENKKLDSGQFDIYFQRIWDFFLEEDKRSYFAYLDSLWFSLYMVPSFKSKVLGWIKKKKIFLKRYVLVPIVLWGHWSLLILCHLGETPQSSARMPCMLLLDSLEMANPRRIEPNIRKFVCDIYKSEGRSESSNFISSMPFLVPKVPQQRNGEECGNYVLYFINLFMMNSPANFRMDKYPYFMNENWFSHESLEQFFQKMTCFEKMIA